MKVLYLLPHCSTGGMPQYVLKQIQSLGNQVDIEVIEVNFYSPHYTVQRDQIEEIVPFYSIYGDQRKLIPFIKSLKPDVIHLQENPEMVEDGTHFIDPDNLKWLYRKDREYTIVLTTHSSLSKRIDFNYIPDRIVAVNKWQKQLFEREMPEAEIDIWEYPIENIKPTSEEKQKARKKLNISDDHSILNIGLFTPGKNQGELFEVARQNPGNLYHFVGNQAGNFKEYWEPLMKNKPSNCIVWGERKDTNLFYVACDEFYFTSKFELNPLVIKESLSYGLPTKLYKLPTYMDDYDNNKLVTYLKQ